MKKKKLSPLNSNRCLDIKSTYNGTQSYENIKNEYLLARKDIGIFNSSATGKIMLYGSRAINLINHGSTGRIDNISESSIFTIIMKKKKFIGEVLVLRISPLRYLVITEYYKKIFKYFKKIQKHYPLVTIDDATNQYSLFTFHGDKSNEYFEKIVSSNLYKTKQQNYIYYQLLIPKKDEKNSFEYFINLNFIPICLETKSIFLYNNGVITNLDKVYKPYRLNVYKIIYPFSNYPYNTKEKLLSIRQYEVQKNILIFKNNKIYNHRRKSVGIIHCSYRMPNKKNPYMIALVKKYQAGRLAIIKNDKQEVLIKQFVNYQE